MIPKQLRRRSADRLDRALVALVIATLIGEIFLADLDLGPFSARVYLLTLALGIVLGRALVPRESPLRSGEARGLCAAYLVFVLWATATQVYHAQEALVSIVYDLGATHLYSLTAFVVTQAALRRRRDIALLAGVMAATTVVSGTFAILQWLGFGWAWDLALTLRPGDTPFQTAWERLIYRHSSRWGVVPGLGLNSLQLSFHLVSFGLFILAWTAARVLAGRPLLYQLIGAAGLLVFALALLLAQTKAAVLGALLAVAFAAGYVVRRWARLPRAPSARAGLALVAGAAALIGLVALLAGSLVEPGAGPGQGRYSLGRQFSWDDSGRLKLWLTALEFGARHPLLGGGAGGFSEFVGYPRGNIAYPFSPHNMFLNAFVWHGLPGLLLLLPLLAAVYVTGRRALRATAGRASGNWIALGAVLGLIADLTIGQFHPWAFTSGITQPWWLLGVLCALIAQPGEPAEQLAGPEPRRKPRTPAGSST